MTSLEMRIAGLSAKSWITSFPTEAAGQGQNVHLIFLAPLLCLNPFTNKLSLRESHFFCLFVFVGSILNTFSSGFSYP